jgi:CubicO group peptidase (beta-lactamase class C family)
VWSKGYGWAHRDDGIPMEPWHRSRIGSVSKLLTTIGMLQLVEDERDDSAALACYLDGSLKVDSDDEQFTGARHRLPPFVFEPGSRSCYSNHGFGLLGHLIDERSGAGPANSYRAVIDRRVLHPLGVYDMVPNNSRIRDGQDAWPHGDKLDASSPSGLGLPTGGWSASARDMARVMCSLDRSSNHQRVLSGQSVQWMESIAYPSPGQLRRRAGR